MTFLASIANMNFFGLDPVSWLLLALAVLIAWFCRNEDPEDHKK